MKKEEASLLLKIVNHFTLWFHCQTLTDVVYGPSTEFAIKLFGPEAPQVMNGEGPKVQHVVPGEGVSLLNHHHFGTHQGELNGCPQAAGTSSDDEALNKREWQIDLITNTRHWEANHIIVTSCCINHRVLRLFLQKSLRWKTVFLPLVY